MAKVKAAFLVVLALAGCTTFPGVSRYHGTDVELFFLEWGAPVASHPRPGGGKEYLWFSGRDSAYKPGHTDVELIGDTRWWEGYRVRWYNPHLKCRIRIITGIGGTIEELRLLADSKGWWTYPRCREVFGPPVP